jgi:hypothetical protein
VVRVGIVTDTLTKPPREYNSLREIYEARIKYHQQQEQEHQQQKHPQQRQQPGHQQKQQEAQHMEKNKNVQLENRFKACACKSPLLPRHERRQRKADNQPDVVPKPPPPQLPLESETVNQIGNDFWR